MIWARLDLSGFLSDIRQGEFSFINDVPLSVMPISPPGTQYTYDAVNQLAVPVVKRRARTILAIYQDILSLTTGPQKVATWADLVSGSPVKISLDTGKNADSIFLLWRIVSQTDFSVSVTNDMKATAIAYYVQDNPIYLVNPPFAPTVNIPGDELDV